MRNEMQKFFSISTGKISRLPPPRMGRRGRKYLRRCRVPPLCRAQFVLRPAREGKEGNYGIVNVSDAHAQTITQTIFLLIPLFGCACISLLTALVYALCKAHKCPDKGPQFRGYKYLAYASNRGVFSKRKKSLAYASRRIQPPPK